MKLLLTSGGLSTPEIIAAFENLCGKKISKISVAFINEGHLVEYGDKRWSIEEMNQVINLAGGTVDLLNIFALSKEQLLNRLRNVDALYVLGGHTDYLMSVFNRTGMSHILKDLPNRFVYVGSSAGAMIMCRRISTEAYKEIYDEGENYGTMEFMNYADFAIIPHLNNPDFPKVREENILKVSKTFDGTIYALNDQQAVLVKDDSITTIGGKVLTLKKGKTLQ